MPTVNVTKASGEPEAYDERKLRRSLANAGAAEAVIDRVAADIREMLYEGIPTQKIYKEAFRLLRQQSARSAGRYKLKEAILELGPSGYPFEKFIGELLKRQGYRTQTGVMVEGDCVSHEIDVVAEKDDSHYIIECKFHNRKGHKCDVKVPLYIQSRFKDVEKKWSRLPGHRNKEHLGWLITNTRFTTDAQKYGNCVGLKLLSWDYPKQKGLKDMIGRVNLHPVTCLSSLSRKQKQALLQNGIVFCDQLHEDTDVLNRIGIDNRKKNRVIKEAREISKMNNRTNKE